MRIMVDLSPETAQWLQEAGGLRGLSIEALAAETLDARARAATGPSEITPGIPPDDVAWVALGNQMHQAPKRGNAKRLEDEEAREHQRKDEKREARNPASN